MLSSGNSRSRAISICKESSLFPIFQSGSEADPLPYVQAALQSFLALKASPAHFLPAYLAVTVHKPWHLLGKYKEYLPAKIRATLLISIKIVFLLLVVTQPSATAGPALSLIRQATVIFHR